MNNKLIYRGFGAISFIVTLITYIMTAQPSTPFWDCGEFSAAATWQQVPHPPGTPLFIMVGKIFQMIIPFGDLNWRVNFVSVVATAFSVLLCYLIIVKVIENLRKEETKKLGDAIAIYGAALIGALAFCFSDTLWFNGVESEVYASTTVLTALSVYFMMRWSEMSDKPGHERYLVMLGYLIVLSSGVHLLALLTIFSITMIVYYKKYTVSVKSFITMTVIGLLVFGVIYKVIIMWLPTLLAGNLPFKNDAQQYRVEGSDGVIVLTILLILGLFVAYWWAHKASKSLPKLIFGALILMIIGYTVNGHILMRANAHPPLNENEPKNFKKLISYLGREQYGETKNWPRRFDARDESKQYYYEKYGKWIPPEVKRITRKDGSEMYDYEFNQINTVGELNYMWNYQIDHMFIRYFMWNFVGKSSDVQDAGWTFSDKKDSDILNYKNGYASEFPVRFWAIPFIIGLIGMFFHFWKDPKYAFSFMIMFLMMGVLATLAQCQLERQPRERDYFYTGAFMVWCIWIGMGVYYLITALSKEDIKTAAATGLIAIGLFIVPVNMGIGGWKIHSRAGNYLPFDFAYNLLQSCEKNGIIFTVGDNDTFPLWNIQDVLGIRRDVRVVNLSLGGTRWYVDEVKNRTPWGTPSIALPFSDESLQVDDGDPKALSYDISDPIKVDIPVARDVLMKFTDDSTIINDGHFRFTFMGESTGGKENKYYYHVSHKLILEILKTTKFERPVYFSITAGSDAYKYGFGKFLRYEGMAMRICPVEVAKTKSGQYEQNIMDQCWLTNVDNTNNYHTEPFYGFKFRNLNNISVYYDDVHRRYLDSYRQTYMNYAANVLQNYKDSTKCVKLLDAMNSNIGAEQFPMLYDEENQLARIYDECNAKEQADYWSKACIKTAKEIQANSLFRNGRVHTMYQEVTGRNGDGTYKCAAQSMSILGDYSGARVMLKNLYDESMKAYMRADQEKNTNETRMIQNNIRDVLGMMYRNEERKITQLENKGQLQDALDTARATIKYFDESPDPTLKSISSYFNDKVAQIEEKIGKKN